MVCRTLDGIRLLTLCVYACRKFGQYIERKGDWSMNFLILCLTALGSFGALFWIAKFIGHKQIAQLDFFDYITGITIGSIAAEMATELEEPWKPLTAMVIYGGATLLLSIIANKFPRTRKYLNGTPTILMVMCRQQGYFDLTNIQTAVFEYNGKLTILPVSSQRPATPNDMNLAPEQELLFTELIMDGRILEDNLKRMGLDLTWLDKQLKQRNIYSPHDVFLAVCDRNLKFVLYEKTSTKN